MKVVKEGQRQLSMVYAADYDAGNIGAHDFKKLTSNFHMFLRPLLKVRTAQLEMLKEREDKPEKKEPNAAKCPSQSAKPESTAVTIPPRRLRFRPENDSGAELHNPPHHHLFRFPAISSINHLIH